jgi:hypothetical protein
MPSCFPLRVGVIYITIQGGTCPTGAVLGVACSSIGLISPRSVVIHGGGVVIGIRAPTWVTCLGRVGLACGMCGPRRRFDIACMLCVLVIIMIVWILMTSCSP